MRNGLLPSMPRFLMAKVAKHSQEGWEQLKWVEAICTACSQVFIHPSIHPQGAQGQPKPHGHRSEITTGQAWAGKLRASL